MNLDDWSSLNAPKKTKMRALAVICLSFWIGSFHGTSAFTYEIDRYSADVTSLCSAFFQISLDTTDPVEQCIIGQPVLNPILAERKYTIDIVIRNAATGASSHGLCTHQKSACKALATPLNDSCGQPLFQCRRALRHLHKMMFVESGEQVCNNFARKSIRGFFHDFMTNGIEGSVLSENHLEMNVGLCRWNQYINVLSDKTLCDPGSIIAMAGQLGYVACGVDIFNMDSEVVPIVTVNRPYTCGPNTEGSRLIDPLTGQRKEEFSDANLAMNSTAMEEFWYHANFHTHKRPDGEVEYSAEATGAAHAIGRVTCPVTGKEGDPNKSFSTGFFHKKRAQPTLADPDFITKGGDVTEVKREYWAGITKIHDTQCFNGGVRASTSTWPLLDGETDFNSEHGFCNMPTQFLETIRMLGHVRVPRWVSITQFSQPEGYPSEHTAFQSPCHTPITMFLPLDLLRLEEIASLPQSEALSSFEEIAFDAVDSIESAWDSCELACDIPIQQNRLCGGEGLQSIAFAKKDGSETSMPTLFQSPSPTPSPTSTPSSSPDKTGHSNSETGSPTTVSISSPIQSSPQPTHEASVTIDTTARPTAKPSRVPSSDPSFTPPVSDDGTSIVSPMLFASTILALFLMML